MRTSVPSMAHVLLRQQCVCILTVEGFGGRVCAQLCVAWRTIFQAACPQGAVPFALAAVAICPTWMWCLTVA